MKPSTGLARWFANTPWHKPVGSRDLPIDTLRGLACLLLAIFHVIGHNASAGLRVPADNPLRLFNEVLGFARMPLFAFLSGYVYAWRPYAGHPLAFVGAKVRRLLVPMVLVGTAYALIQYKIPASNTTEVINWQMLHIVPVSHYWFLESLFFIFVTMMAVEHFALINTLPSYSALFVVGVFLHLAHPLPIYFGLYGVAYLFPYFLLGVGLNRFQFTGKYRWIVPALLAATAIAIAYLLYAKEPMPQPFSAYELLFGLTACLFFYSLKLRVRWLAWIGFYSFGIYLFHSMFSAASRIFFSKLGIASNMGATATSFLLVTGVAAAIFGPILLQPLLLRVPYIGRWMLGEKFADKPAKTTAKAAADT